MAKNKTQTVRAAFFGGNEYAAFILANAILIALAAQKVLHSGLQLQTVERAVLLQSMGKGPQAAAAYMFLERAGITYEFGTFANETKGGRDDQKAHDDQNPAAVIVVPEVEDIEHLI